MTTREKLKEKADNMNKYLQEKCGSEPNEIIDRIELLSILISQSGEFLAESKYYHDTCVHSAIMNAIKEGYNDKLSATALNKFVSSLAKEENFLVNHFDRINSAAVHQLDGLRSVLSYRKAEFSTLSYAR